MRKVRVGRKELSMLVISGLLAVVSCVIAYSWITYFIEWQKSAFPNQTWLPLVVAIISAVLLCTIGCKTIIFLSRKLTLQEKPMKVQLRAVSVHEKEKKGYGWFWYIIFLIIVFLSAGKVEPLQTGSFPWFLTISVFFISIAIGIMVGLHKGKIVRRERSKSS